MSSVFPCIVAHRGASGLAPENTLAAFQEAWRQDADVVEADCHLTADGQVVCIHDSTTKRTGHLNLTVSESSFSALRQVDVGAWKGERWKGERIPSLTELLRTVPQGKGVYLEVKTGPEILPALSNVLQVSSVPLHRIMVIAFDQRVVEGYKRLHPKGEACWLTKLRRWPGGLRPGPESILHTLEQSGADGVGLEAHPALSADFVGAILDAGYGVHVWTEDDPLRARRLLDMGVQSVTTNFPGRLKQALID